MKKLKYLLLIIPFSFISSVYANEVGGDIQRQVQTQIDMPPTAQCFNSSYDSINTRFSDGNYLEDGFIVGSSTYNCSFGSRGVYSFSTNFLTDDNQLYSIAIYLGNSSGSALSSLNKLGIADSTYVARNQIVYNGNNATLFSSRLLSNAGDFYDPTGNASNPLTYVKYSIIYIVFAAHSNANSIAIDFSWDGSPTNSYLFGYHLESLGSASNLSQSDVSRIVENATSDLATQSSINQLQETNNEIKQGITDVDNTLKDDNIDTSKTTIEDKSADASNSPISSLLTLPLKLLNNINTGLSGTCSAFNLGSLFGTDLILPCINLEQRLGSFLWGLIDSFFCIFLIYNVGMLAIKIWTDVIMMKDFFSDLYKPSGEKGGKKE